MEDSEHTTVGPRDDGGGVRRGHSSTGPRGSNGRGSNGCGSTVGVQRTRIRRPVLRTSAAAAVLAAAALSLSACDSDVTGQASANETTVPSLQARASAPTTQPTPSPIPSTAPPASDTAAPPTTPGEAQSGGGEAQSGGGTDAGASVSTCRTDGLDVHLGRAGGAAGSIYAPIVFTNTSGGPCVIDGYPGVSYVDASGAQVGSAAVRDGAGGAPITLAPGDSASAQLRMPVVFNYPSEKCHPEKVAGLRVYPPNNTVSVVLDHSGTGCATDDPDVVQLSVQAAVPGTGR